MRKPSSAARRDECRRHKPNLITLEECGGLFADWILVGEWWECEYCGIAMAAPSGSRAA